ncbi:hypothetical protein Emag_001396 [Eimeria magna]
MTPSAPVSVCDASGVAIAPEWPARLRASLIKARLFNELCTLDGFWGTPRLQQLSLVANHLLLLSDLAPLGTAAPQLRQLWVAGNPLHVRPHLAQPLQQLLPALELLDGHSLLEISAKAPDQVSALVEFPVLVHGDSHPIGDAVELHPHKVAPKRPLDWDLAAAAHLRFQGANEGQRYWAEDAQLLACSLIIPKLGPHGMLEELRLAGGAEPLPLALLLPPCAGPSRMCCCFCCCCCSCSKHDALSTSGNRTPRIQWSGPADAAVAAAQQMTSCGGLCSVAAAIREATLSYGDRLYDRQLARTPSCSYFSWAHWQERVDALELSFLRLRVVPNIQSFVGLRRLELSENRLKSIECPALRVLDLRGTPLSEEKEYRSYSLYLLPSLKVLDGVEPDQRETAEDLLLANNNIDIPAGGLGGSKGPGLSAVPLLERLDLSFNALRELKSLDEAPLGSLRVLELRGNGLTKIEGLLRCCRLEVLDLSDNKIRRIEAEGFRGASATLRCLILERNGLRFQQNPACQRRHWRALLAEQLPHLEAIDGESISLEEISRVHLGWATEGAPRECDHPLPLQNTTSEDAATVGPISNLTSQQHNLLPQFQRVAPHSTKPPKSRLLLPAKQGELPCSGPSLLRQVATSSDLRVLDFGVVGVGAPGALIEGGLETAQPRHESFLMSSSKRRGI